MHDFKPITKIDAYLAVSSFIEKIALPHTDGRKEDIPFFVNYRSQFFVTYYSTFLVSDDDDLFSHVARASKISSVCGLEFGDITMRSSY